MGILSSLDLDVVHMVHVHWWPSRVRDSSKAGIDKWRFTIRKEWNVKPFLGLSVMIILFLLAITELLMMLMLTARDSEDL